MSEKNSKIVLLGAPFLVFRFQNPSLILPSSLSWQAYSNRRRIRPRMRSPALLSAHRFLAAFIIDRSLESHSNFLTSEIVSS
jgi:hypothetical protein